MNYLPNKKGFLGIDNKFSINEKVVIVPFGLEKTVTYGKGTKNGPKEIIKASHQVELYDEDLNCEPYKKIGIKIVDAPVSGGVMGAKNATLTFLVGGSKDAFDLAKPLLEIMGKNIFHAWLFFHPFL